MKASDRPEHKAELMRKMVLFLCSFALVLQPLRPLVQSYGELHAQLCDVELSHSEDDFSVAIHVALGNTPALQNL